MSVSELEFDQFLWEKAAKEESAEDTYCNLASVLEDLRNDKSSFSFSGINIAKLNEMSITNLEITRRKLIADIHTASIELSEVIIIIIISIYDNLLLILLLKLLF